MPGSREKSLVLWLNEIGMEDVPLVGGKNASLGEMYQKLNKNGIKIPDAFAVTSYAYQYFLDYVLGREHLHKNGCALSCFFVAM